MRFEKSFPLGSALRATLLLIVSTRGALASEPGKTRRFDKSIRREIGDLPLVVLRGNELERARAFGALAGQDLARMLSDSYVPMFNQKSTNGGNSVVAV